MKIFFSLFIFLYPQGIVHIDFVIFFHPFSYGNNNSYRLSSVKLFESWVVRIWRHGMCQKYVWRHYGRILTEEFYHHLQLLLLTSKVIFFFTFIYLSQTNWTCLCHICKTVYLFNAVNCQVDNYRKWHHAKVGVT